MRTLAIRGEGAPLQMSLDEIGGGKVMWPFRMGGELVKHGTYLTAEQIMSIRPANRASLIGRFIRVHPKAPGAEGLASPLARAGADPDRAADGRVAKARHIVPLGFGRYQVIEGEIVSDKALSRSEAYALAGIPEPPKRGDKEH